LRTHFSDHLLLGTRVGDSILSFWVAREIPVKGVFLPLLVILSPGIHLGTLAPASLAIFQADIEYSLTGNLDCSNRLRSKKRKAG
jgi:hypothetical protein